MNAVELDADRTTTATDAPSDDPLLADLRRLWARPGAAKGREPGQTVTPTTTARTIGTPTPVDCDRKPTAAELLAARKPARCDSHADPDGWRDEPAGNRPGWLRTTCRRCGAFIGYRPSDPTKSRRTANVT